MIQTLKNWWAANVVDDDPHDKADTEAQLSGMCVETIAEALMSREQCHTREITIHRIAETRVRLGAVEDWLSDVGVEEWEHPHESCDSNSPESSRKDQECVSDPEYLIALAGKRCYMSFKPGLNPNVTKTRDNYTEYLANILSSGHGSVLEHANFTYAIEGVTRVFTAEMNRHRAGWAISEGSLRYIRFEEVPYWLPLSLREDASDTPEIAEKKRVSREVFAKAFSQDAENYTTLMNLWDIEEATTFKYKKEVTSCFRRIVGMGVSTGGVWTGNARGLRHVLTMRCSEAAEEEIRHVFTMIAEDIIEDHPLIFGDFERNEKGYFQPKYMKV